MDLIRNIVLITLGLSAAYLVLTKQNEFNQVITGLTGNWTKLLITARGERA